MTWRSLLSPDEREAAEALAERLREAEVLPLLAVAGEARAAEGIRASGACAVLVGRSGLGDWAREGLAAARALAVRDRAFRLVLVLLPGAPDPGDPSLAYLAAQPWVDLRAGAGDAMAAADLVRALRGAEVPAGLAPTAEDVSPYRGLEAFREEDADLFFGREQDVARLVERLRSARFVAVMGASGSGKSSLVQAGLLPALRLDAVPGSGEWRVLEILPGARPLASLAAQLAHLPGAGAPSAADLAADERALDMAVARALDGRPAGDRVCWSSSTSSRRSSPSATTRVSAPPSSGTSSTPPRSPAGGPSSSPRCGPTSTTGSPSTPRRALWSPITRCSSGRSTPGACAGPSRSRPAAAASSWSPASPAASSPTSPTVRAPCPCSSTCCTSCGAVAVIGR